MTDTARDAREWGAPGMRVAEHPLNFMLMISVPLHMQRLANQGGPTEQDWADLKALDGILERAYSVLLYPGKDVKEGEIADAFNALARGLAVLSYAPGGVPFAGEQWDATRLGEICRGFVQVPEEPGEEVKSAEN